MPWRGGKAYERSGVFHHGFDALVGAKTGKSTNDMPGVSEPEGH